MFVSDGDSTDGDPLPLARKLQQENVTIAAAYLTGDRAVPHRRLYDRAPQGWNTGQRTLFDMAARVAGATHPIPVLASMGWEVPSSGECALLDVIGRVRVDVYIDNKHARTHKKPSNHRWSPTCYAHATAAVLHMALLRIVRREGGYPSIKVIRARISRNFRPDLDGWDMEEMLEMATT